MKRTDYTGVKASRKCSPALTEHKKSKIKASEEAMTSLKDKLTSFPVLEANQQLLKD
jgi:hypothetical protein